MNCTEAKERMGLAERVIAAWERLGRPGGKLEDTLRIIGEEIDLLDAIAADHPPMAVDVAPLVARYRSMQTKLKLSAD